MENDKQCQFEDQILQKYTLLEFKGKGAYGVVWKAQEKQTKQIVALKKVFDAFHNQTDSQRTFREVIFLEQVSKNSNIIKLLQVIRAQNNKDLYMVFEYMETDLHKVIRANILEPIHKKYVIYQLLKAIKFLHSGDIIHRDLKPANLLINADCIVKLADFGLARTVNSNEEDVPILTEYVATRWYRAPEILLGSQKYSKAVDMWSIGCILGEMILGKAIFPGTSTMNQVEMILEVLGTPTEDDIQAIQAPLAKHIIINFQQLKSKSFKQVFPQESEDTLNFLKGLLIFNPSKRLTVEQALSHPYMAEFVGSEEETIIDFPVQTLMNDNVKYSIEEYMQALYDHIAPKQQPVLSQQQQQQQAFFSQNQSPLHSNKPPLSQNASPSIISKKSTKVELHDGYTINSENKLLKQIETKKKIEEKMSALEKFKSIENMIKQQKAKLGTSNEQISVPNNLKSQYGNKSVNITRGESIKKKEASCELQSPNVKSKISKIVSYTSFGGNQKLQQLTQNVKSQSKLVKIESQHEKFINKKTYLQYILSGQAKPQK